MRFSGRLPARPACHFTSRRACQRGSHHARRNGASVAGMGALRRLRFASPRDDALRSSTIVDLRPVLIRSPVRDRLRSA
jgi:hypothetical protein